MEHDDIIDTEGNANGPDMVVRHAMVELVFEDAESLLVARVVPSDEPMEMDLPALRGLIEREGYAELSFRPDALNNLQRRLRDLEFGEYPLAARVDAEISVGVTSDRMQALLTTSRAYGGQPVTAERLEQAVADAGLSPARCLPDAIAAALNESAVSNWVIAKGVPPQSGADSRVELLIDLDREAARPKETADGRVDHYSVREFIIVEPDTPVLKRHPATKGIAGQDVLGRPITARDGREIPLPREMPGVRADETDETVLVAEYKGHPVPIPGGIRVDKTLVMEHVDLRTGNVDFDGSVLVKGDVTAGVTVKATGDVTIKGSVENASVEAGNDLLVARGITGSESANRGGARTVSIQAAGDVHAAFASGVRIRTAGNVVVKEYLNHCEAVADDSVLVGQNGGRGVVVGGRIHGNRGVACKMAGSLANVPTMISAGPHQELRHAHEEALAERTALASRLAQLRDAQNGMTERAGTTGNGPQGELLAKLRRTVQEFEERDAEVERTVAALERELEDAAHATVVCSGSVYPGVTIEIDDASLTVRHEGSGGRFGCRDGEIHWD